MVTLGLRVDGTRTPPPPGPWTIRPSLPGSSSFSPRYPMFGILCTLVLVVAYTCTSCCVNLYRLFCTLVQVVVYTCTGCCVHLYRVFSNMLERCLCPHVQFIAYNCTLHGLFLYLMGVWYVLRSLAPLYTVTPKPFYLRNHGTNLTV